MLEYRQIFMARLVLSRRTMEFTIHSLVPTDVTLRVGGTNKNAFER